MKSKNKQNTAKRRIKLKQRYYFFLNPYTDAGFTKCPKCDTKTNIRKYFLLIHIEPRQLISLDKTCKYCPCCDMVIAKKYELDSNICKICEENFPELAGNEYFVYGTLDMKDRRKIQKGNVDFKTALEWAYAFNGAWNFKPAYASYLTREKIKIKEKNRKLLTADDIYRKHDDVEDAIREFEKEIYRRVDLFAQWLHDKKFGKDEINVYAINILSSQLVATVHEPPYMFLEDVEDDIPEGRIVAGESYGFLFKYHVFLDVIKETDVDKKYIKALKLYFDFLLENNFIEEIPDVVKEVFGKEKIYLRRLKEYHDSDSEDEGWIDWFREWCEEVFEI